MFQFIFKNLIIFIFCLVFLLGCDDIPRDNILDPKNPTSERPKIVTVEAFVNTNPNATYFFNDTLLNALDQIKNTYNNKITVLEYHLKTIVTALNDTPWVYSLNETIYDNYLEDLVVKNKGVPDVFINGIAARVQGASTVQNSIIRLEEALQPFIIQNSLFSLEPMASIQNNEINLSVKIARLGSTNAQNILVKAIIIYKIDDEILKRVAYGIAKSTIIGEIENGEIKDVDIDPVPLATFQYQSISVIVMVTSEDEKTIYQSIEVDIP